MKRKEKKRMYQKMIKTSDLSDGRYNIVDIRYDIYKNGLLTLGYQHLLPGSIAPELDEYEYREIQAILDDRTLKILEREEISIEMGNDLLMYNGMPMKLT